MATILMTLAEKKAPRRYEWLINLLTFGRRIKIFKYIKFNYLQEDQLLLDAGCGNGRFIEIADRSWVNSIGIDLSEDMLHQARKKIAGRKFNPPLIQTSITNLPMRIETFDIVICTLVLSELDQNQVKRSLREFFYCLKNNGLLILVTESKPNSKLKYYVFSFLRIPAFLLAALIAKVPRHSVHDIKTLLQDHPGRLLEEKSYLGGHLSLFVMRKMDNL